MEPLDIIDRSYFLRRHAPTKTSNRRATRAPQMVEDAPGSTHKHPKAAGALVRATGGLMGVMKVTPCGCDQNFRGVAAPGCQKLLLPSSGEKIDLNTLKLTGENARELSWLHRGQENNPLAPPFHFRQAATRVGGLDCRSTPRGPKNSKQTLTQQSTT